MKDPVQAAIDVLVDVIRELRDVNADLLAACEAYLVAFALCSCDFGPPGGPECLACKTRAAVAKARGESPRRD